MCNNSKVISNEYMTNYSKMGKFEGTKSLTRKTVYNNDFKWANKAKKSTLILGQSRKSTNFRIKYHDPHSIKRKSKMHKDDNNSKLNDYTFDMEREDQNKNETRDYEVYNNRSYTSATPFSKTYKPQLEGDENGEYSNSESKYFAKVKHSTK